MVGKKKGAQAKVDLANYLAKYWCKAFMRPDAKCDSIDNNICKAFNRTIVKARTKPIIPMLEDIRVAIMKRVATKIQAMEKWPGKFRPRVMRKLNENILESVGSHVNLNGDDGYEIKMEGNNLG